MKRTRPTILLCGVLLLAGTLTGQIRITETRVLDLPETGMWGYAAFSPDGQSVFYSTLSYAGIWKHDLRSGQTTEITKEEGTGFGFSVSPDGRKIAYRKTTRGAKWTDRTQDIIVKDLSTGAVETIASARTVSAPVFMEESVSFIVGDDLQPSPPKRSGVFLQGIVDQKIVLTVNGAARTIDPLGNGSYIWPSLSPDKSFILAYDMRSGAFISTMEGELRQRLGRAEGPVWTRDGNWVVYFSEENDGYRITGGDIHAMKKDGSGKTALTDTPSRVELFPATSPTENRIVCHTMDGKLLIMTYVVTP